MEIFFFIGTDKNTGGQKIGKSQIQEITSWETILFLVLRFLCPKDEIKRLHTFRTSYRTWPKIIAGLNYSSLVDGCINEPIYQSL